MYWLAIDREAVTAQQLQADLPLVSQTKLRDALISLDRRSLIEKIKPNSTNSDALTLSDCVSYTQQPVVMEYVIERSIEQITHEVEQTQIDCLGSHALLKVQTQTMCETYRYVQRALVAP
jgi:hypothetical protein